MREDEAKTKDCCGPPAEAWARIALHHVEAGWAEFLRDRPKCVASACMAWRWKTDDAYRIEADAEFRRTGARKSPTEGFCGLAGQPS